jgi:hypothetical protein
MVAMSSKAPEAANEEFGLPPKKMRMLNWRTEAKY